MLALAAAIGLSADLPPTRGMGKAAAGWVVDTIRLAASAAELAITRVSYWTRAT